MPHEVDTVDDFLWINFLERSQELSEHIEFDLTADGVRFVAHSPRNENKTRERLEALDVERERLHALDVERLKLKLAWARQALRHRDQENELALLARMREEPLIMRHESQIVQRVKRFFDDGRYAPATPAPPKYCPTLFSLVEAEQGDTSAVSLNRLSRALAEAYRSEFHQSPAKRKRRHGGNVHLYPIERLDWLKTTIRRFLQADDSAVAQVQAL